MFKRIPGTRDILPQELDQWQEIEETSRKIFSLYNYQEIRPPIIEDMALFSRSLGETNEVVQKQMFLIRNKDGVYALRPEGTAPVVRAYVENNLDKTAGFLKFYYMGPMFRLERPQKGRLRQFHHIGVEAIGSQDPALDIEIISLADSLLKALAITGYKIKINSLGCAKDKKKLTLILRHGLRDKLSKLCPDCKVRFKKNILRVLDCKNETCQEIGRTLDIKDRTLCPACKTHFVKVEEGLVSLKLRYEVVPYLVRGLDYYTRTVFEITHPELGSQDALAAGGRYDNLVKELGGPDVGAIGFAFGVERLLLVKMQNVKCKMQNLIYLINLGEEAKKTGLNLLSELRKKGICADTDYTARSLKGSMRRADDLGARYVLILGEDELGKGVITLKDMISGEQRQVRQEDLILNIKNDIFLGNR